MVLGGVARGLPLVKGLADTPVGILEEGELEYRDLVKGDGIAAFRWPASVCSLLV